MEVHLEVTTRWSSKGSMLSVLSQLLEVPVGGWQGENGLRSIQVQPQIAGFFYAEAKSNGNS